MKTLLIVDDDKKILSLLQAYLERNQFRVISALNGETALQMYEQHPEIELVVLDVMLPDLDGFQVCRLLRKRSDVPILMLTANIDETDRIVGLELGADDYLGKPFNPRELLARIKAILRRVEGGNAQQPTCYFFADFCLDCVNRTLMGADGQEVVLSGNEFMLLQYLVQRAGSIVERSQLIEATHGRDLGPLDRNLDVQISRLRSKLKDEGKQPRFIKTVRGVGYVFACEVSVDAPD
ncbi:response regulator [Nitrincola alkalilacustris]|uniref:response regulator n=1 Tax=Nitrincola alkalilacustris TaxID=1571224 RepID=UPI00124CDB8A|nr:response regulator transcription factor [Nitrincola alkalilacustris]